MAGITYSKAERSAPVWAADGIGKETLMPAGGRLEVSQFLAEDAVVVTVATGGAAQNATSVPVTALAKPIPANTILHFGGAKLAVLTAAAAAGATSLTVAAIPTALVANDTATYRGVGRVVVSAGTLIGRTFTERGNNIGFGPADVATPDDEIFLVAQDVHDAARTPEVELYRHQRLVKENFLPNWATLSAQAKAAIRSRYQCITAQAE